MNLIWLCGCVVVFLVGIMLYIQPNIKVSFGFEGLEATNLEFYELFLSNSKTSIQKRS